MKLGGWVKDPVSRGWSLGTIPSLAVAAEKEGVVGLGGCSGGQETGAFPPSVGAEGSAYHKPGCGRTSRRELGPSDSSLLREAPGTPGPCARRSVPLPAAGENFPPVRPGPRQAAGPTAGLRGSLCPLDSKCLQPHGPWQLWGRRLRHLF